MTTKSNYVETAKDQMERHQAQVSGVWSIDAKQFCEEAGVDYDAAVDHQNIREYEDNEEYEAELISEYAAALGYLTDKQLENIRDEASLVGVNDDGYSAYFWQNVVEQLEDKE